jgi:hypothetical protein
VFYFDIHPVAADIKRIVVDDVNERLKILRKNDADVDDWVDTGELNELVAESEDDGFTRVYVKIVRRGFRQLFGRANVHVNLRKNRPLRIRIEGLTRLTTLACVRRINRECDHVNKFSRDKFAIISKFRGCQWLKDLIPSDDELAQFCGMEGNF